MKILGLLTLIGMISISAIAIEKEKEWHTISAEFRNGSLTPTIENLQDIDDLLLIEAKKVCGEEAKNITMTALKFEISGCGLFDLTGQTAKGEFEFKRAKSFFYCYPLVKGTTDISCE